MSNDQTPIFIDLHGGGGMPGEEEPEPIIPKCWHGREKLWVVFWAYGMFGTGAIIAMSLGMIFIGIQVGLILAPSDTSGGLFGAVLGIVLGAAALVPYLIWMTVSLWRCAPNGENPLWGRLVRGLVVAEWIGVAMAGYNFRHLLPF